ncbi:ATP-binding protein [Mycobacterium sp. NBC_00419]|uniref:ATP-binding protein n=1 Tax=Mycobacterium sp. NBC_00419 TaxID=2975989 RepID=UPI002E1D7CE9
MTTTSYPSPDGDRFADNGVDADARSVGRVRDEFAHWLRAHTGVDAVLFSDIVLAANEALANAAEFAYVRDNGIGGIDVEAVHNPAAATLTVTVADQGCWREPDPATRSSVRGRGIPLMRALADEVTIDSSALGTTVCLRFDNVPAVLRADVSV